MNEKRAVFRSDEKVIYRTVRKKKDMPSEITAYFLSYSEASPGMVNVKFPNGRRLVPETNIHKIGKSIEQRDKKERTIGKDN